MREKIGKRREEEREIMELGRSGRGTCSIVVEQERVVGILLFLLIYKQLLRIGVDFL